VKNGSTNSIRVVSGQGESASQAPAPTGLRPIQIWVPDMRSPAFVKEAHRQSAAVAKSPHAKEDQDFIEAVSERAAK